MDFRGEILVRFAWSKSKKFFKITQFCSVATENVDLFMTTDHKMQTFKAAAG